MTHGLRLAVVVGAAAVAGAVAVGCRSREQPPTRPALTFHDVTVQALQQDPTGHTGDVFVERFLFSRVWWGPDRAHANQLSTDLPTHFEARVVAAPIYVARIEIPASKDDRFAAMREGTELCLRVRFLRVQQVSNSPVFAYEGDSTECAARRPGS